MALREGDIVGNYVIQEQLGQGGMATVFKGYHEALDRYVAVKVMHQNFLDDASFIARFRREAQIVARLTHPHIVPVFDFGEYEKLPYLVMKYVEGETLKQRLNRQVLELNEILKIITAVGSALTYAHEQDILHRDIKPSNIVLDKQETPYITDFGLARLASSGESTMSADMLLGTPHYISPEQAQGATNIDGRADIYSLGVVLYELLVGHVPYTADTPYAIIHDHIYRPLPSPMEINPDIPSAVEMVLYRALEKKPENRYATANEMVTDLKDAIEEANLTSLRPDRIEVAATSIARNRANYAQTENLTPTSTIPRDSIQSVRLSDLKRKKSPTTWHENERFWQTSGCASFLVISFIALAILVNMGTNLGELATINADNHIMVEIHADDRQLTSDFADLGIEYDSENVRVLVPDTITAQEAASLFDSQSNDPITYLVTAFVVWDDDAPTARQRIFNGFALTTRDNRATYFNSASYLAQEANDEEGALLFSILALESAVKAKGAPSNTIRDISGQFLYDEVSNTQDLTLREMTTFIRNMNTDSAFDFDAADSVAARFALARQLFNNENYALALTTLNRNVDEENPLRAEFDLIFAEINIEQEDFVGAERILQGILETSNIPSWLHDRAQKLQDDLTN